MFVAYCGFTDERVILLARLRLNRLLLMVQVATSATSTSNSSTTAAPITPTMTGVGEDDSGGVAESCTAVVVRLEFLVVVGLVAAGRDITAVKSLDSLVVTKLY